MNILRKMVSFLKKTIRHDGFRRYGSNMVWLLVEKAIRLLIGFSVGVYVARQLGPEQYGLLNYCISFAAIFSVLVSLGLDAILVRELVKYPEKRERLLGSAWGLKAGGAGLMLLLLWLFLYCSGTAAETRQLTLIIGAGYLFQTLQILDLYFQSQVQSRYVAISQIIALLFCSILRVWGAWYGFSLTFFAGVEAGYMALSCTLYLIFYCCCGGKPGRWRFDPGVAGELVRYSYPLFFISLAVMVHTRMDQLIVKQVLGDAANGQYAVAGRIVELFLIFATIMNTTLLPSLVGTRNTSLRRYYLRLKGAVCVMFYLALFAVVPVMLAGSRLIELLYGPEYLLGAQIFQVYILKIVVLFPCMVMIGWGIAENMQKYSLYLSFFEAGGSLLINYVFISRWGIWGAAAAAAVIPVYNGLLLPLSYRKGRYGVKIVLGAIAMPWRYGLRRFLALLEAEFIGKA